MGTQVDAQPSSNLPSNYQLLMHIPRSVLLWMEFGFSCFLFLFSPLTHSQVFPVSWVLTWLRISFHSCLFRVLSRAHQDAWQLFYLSAQFSWPWVLADKLSIVGMDFWWFWGHFFLFFFEVVFGSMTCIVLRLLKLLDWHRSKFLLKIS